jgi:hypothetical protein
VSAVIRTKTGGRLDFWTLENSIAGRGRRYHRAVIDEGAFTKDGDNKTNGSMMEVWEKSIKPTLYDYRGEALVCSNTARILRISSITFAPTRGMASWNTMPPRWTTRCFQSASRMKPRKPGWSVEVNFSPN